MAKDVQINIRSDNSEIGETIGDLKRMADRTFKEIKKSAEEQSEEVTKAFRKMGIRTEEAIKKSTKEAKENYRKIKNSGTASANDIKRAHDVMTKRIESNNKELGRSTLNLTTAMKGLSAPLRTATKAAGLLGVAVAAVGTALGVKAFGESVKFESAVLDLQKVLGDTEGEASDFIDTATNLSNKFGISATDVLAGATGFKQAGFTIKEAFDLQKIAIEQSIAGGITVEESAERIKNALRGFGIEAKEAGRLTDVLNEVSNKFGTNTKELAEGVAVLSPVAKAAGLSIEETAGFLTPIIEVFGSGNEAATALKTGFLSLVDPTKAADVAFANMGISTRDLNGEQKTAKDLALELAAGFNKLTNTQQLQATAAIFGKNQAARLQTVFSNLSRVTDVTAAAMDSAGSRIKEVEVRMSSAEVQIDVAKQQFNNMARALGDNFRDEVVNVIGELGNLATKFKELIESGGLEPLLDVIRPKLEDLQERIQNLADNLPDFIEKTRDAFNSILRIVDGILDFTRQVKIAVLEAAEPVFLLARGVGFLTDALGISEVAAETFRITIEENEKEMKRLEDVIAGTVEKTVELNDSNDDAIDTLAELNEELKRNDEAIAKNIKSKEKAIEVTKKATEAVKNEVSTNVEGTAGFVGPPSPGTSPATAEEKSATAAASQEVSTGGGGGGGVSVSTGFKLPKLRDFLQLPADEKQLLARSRGISVDELLKMIRLRMKEGGIIDASAGQLIPGGYGGGDKVPLLGEPGEGMIKKEAVRAMGTDAIHRINNLDFSGLLNNLFKKDAQRLQEGGIVTGSGEGETVNVNLLMGEKSHPMKSSKVVADELLENIRTNNIVNGRGKRIY